MKNLIKILLVFVAFVCLSFVKPENKIVNVVIDSGHGGYDLGAKIDEITEKKLVEEITNKIKALHNDTKVIFHYTRSNDEFIGLMERANFINQIKPDLAISLHLNQNKNTEANGFEVYVSANNIQSEKSKELADKLVSKFATSPLKNLGVKTAPFLVLKKSEYPIMVVELGYISNKSDRKYLTSESGQTEIAKNILEFVSDLK